MDKCEISLHIFMLGRVEIHALFHFVGKYKSRCGRNGDVHCRDVLLSHIHPQSGIESVCHMHILGSEYDF